MSGNDLIVDAKANNWATGGGILSDTRTLINDLNSDTTDALDISIDAALETIAIIGLVLDPLGGFFKAGVGWIIEHVDFLREPVNALLGNPNDVQAVASTWMNVGTYLMSTAGDLDAEHDTIASWQGDASDHYRDTLEAMALMTRGAGGASMGISSMVTAAGVVTGMLRDELYKMIAGFVERVVIYIITALASSWFTFGASIEVAIGVIEVDAEMQTVSIETTTVQAQVQITVYTGKLGKIAAKVLPVIEKLKSWKTKMDATAFNTKFWKPIVKSDWGTRVTKEVKGADASRKGADAKDES